MPVLLPLLSSGEGLLLTSAEAGQFPDPSQALMQSRVTPLALPGSNTGLAEVRVRVNPWSYSGLGSWYELPYINPHKVLGQGCFVVPLGSIQVFSPSAHLAHSRDGSTSVSSILLWPYI